MIKRIVKLTFKPEEVKSFLMLFDANKEKISGFPGCQSVELLQDIDRPNIFFTYSFWNAVEDLERYRNSDLFKEIWAHTKVKFDDKPEAWSVQAIDT